MNFVDAFQLLPKALHFIKDDYCTKNKLNQKLYNIPVDISDTKVKFYHGDTYQVCVMDSVSVHIVHRAYQKAFIVRVFPSDMTFNFQAHYYDGNYSVCAEQNHTPIALKVFGSHQRAVDWVKDYLKFGLVEDMFTEQASFGYVK